MKVFLASLLPGNFCGAIVRFLATAKRPRFLVRWLIKVFRAQYKIDESLAQKPEGGFPTLLDFFLREPLPEARPIDTQEKNFITPCEALLSKFGYLEENSFLVVKGESCRLDDLIEGDASFYNGGLYAILYLSPADFHRIYAPCDAKLLSAKLVPGAKKPVFTAFVEKHPKVFITNQRVVMEFESAMGRFLLVAVGALNVGEIRTEFALPFEGGYLAKKSKEIAAFEFGSTVVLAFEPKKIKKAEGVAEGAKILLGRPLAQGTLDIEGTL